MSSTLVRFKRPADVRSRFDVTALTFPRFPMRGREPSATRFRRGTENRGFHQIKKFLRQMTPKNKLHYFSKKIFLVLGAL